MKVVHVSNYFRDTHDHVGGAEQACYRTMRMLVDNGHETVVATQAFDHPEAARSFLPARVEELPTFEERLPAFPRRYLEVLKWYSLQYDGRSRSAFRRLLDREKPDVIHFHNFQFLTFSLVREARRQGIPTCLSIYDYWVFCPIAMLRLPQGEYCEEGHGTRCLQCLPDLFKPVQWALLAMRPRIFEKTFREIDRFIVLSEHSAGVLQHHGIPAEKIEVVPLTLPLEYDDDDEVVDPELPEGSILFVGWLNERKGALVALEAMVEVLKRCPDAVLHLIGGKAKFAGPYEQKMEDTVRNNGLQDRVKFLGHQSPETVQQYLKHCHVLILPEQYENMSPLIMVEGMMLGKPVVASRVGGIPEYIRHGENGFLAEPGSPGEFADSIVSLLEDPGLRQRIGDNASRSIRERNQNEVVWQRTMSAYEATIAAN